MSYEKNGPKNRHVGSVEELYAAFVLKCQPIVILHDEITGEPYSGYIQAIERNHTDGHMFLVRMFLAPHYHVNKAPMQTVSWRASEPANQEVAKWLYNGRDLLPA